MGFVSRLLAALLTFCAVEARAELITTGVGAGGFGGVGGYTPPTLTSPYAIVVGDSITQNAGGMSLVNTTQVTFTYTETGNGYPGWLPALSNNSFVFDYGYNYGVGGQTSAGIYGRAFTTGSDSNAVQNTTRNTFTGAYGTVAASVTGGVTSFTFTYVGGLTAMTDVVGCSGAACPYVQYSNNNYNCQASSISGSASPYTIAIPASCGWSSVTSGQTVSLSPPAKSSAFVAALGASGVGATNSDINNSFVSGSGYSFTTDPARVVFQHIGVNDSNLTFASTPGTWDGTSWSNQQQPITNQRALIEALGPSGANKILIMSDQIPTGLATSWSSANSTYNGSAEVHTIPSSAPYTITVAKAALFYDDYRVQYAPCGATTSGATDTGCGTSGSGQFTAGANDGTLLTLVASAPAAGQYSVASGVYTFNAADAGSKVAIDYRWRNNSHNLRHVALHDWLSASASSGNACGALGTTFVGTMSGYTLPAPAANCPSVYPWVHVAATWAATVDSTAYDSTNGVYDYPIWGCLADGLHPGVLCSARIAAAMLAAVPAYAKPAQQFASPTTGAVPTITAGTSNLTGNYTSSVCNSTVRPELSAYMNATGPLKTNTLNGVTPMASGLYAEGSPIYIGNNSSGLPMSGAHVVCVDTTNSYLVLDAAATTISTLGTNVLVANDSTTFWPWGVIDYVNGINAVTVTGCGNCFTTAQMTALLGTTVKAGYAPRGWGTPTLDSASQTAVANGNLGLGFGVEQNPLGDGYDDFVEVLQGYAGTASVSFKLTLSISNGAASSLAIGDRIRASCEVLISPGPNGHLTGVSGVQMTMSSTVGSGAAFIPPTLSSGAYTVWAGIAGAAGGSALTDLSVAAGAPAVTSGRLTQTIVSPPVLIKSTYSGNGLTLIATLNTATNANDPVSAVMRIRRCKLSKVSY